MSIEKDYAKAIEDNFKFKSSFFHAVENVICENLSSSGENPLSFRLNDLIAHLNVQVDNFNNTSVQNYDEIPYLMTEIAGAALQIYAKYYNQNDQQLHAEKSGVAYDGKDQIS